MSDSRWDGAAEPTVLDSPAAVQRFRDSVTANIMAALKPELDRLRARVSNIENGAATRRANGKD
jgi:hypothetical protein